MTLQVKRRGAQAHAAASLPLATRSVEGLSVR